jgi:hypothetical protein
MRETRPSRALRARLGLGEAARRIALLAVIGMAAATVAAAPALAATGVRVPAPDGPPVITGRGLVEGVGPATAPAPAMTKIVSGGDVPAEPVTAAPGRVRIPSAGSPGNIEF